ncbi:MULTISPECIES: beta-propeller fold lactonase family protein [unclassified Herbaspirillum]|nr:MULTISPECIES: beta-propeller fold lactonase family protein [unclassified Herbaspirillum]RFB68905.1 lactonase family protein [Herbaspirillum sp. 3R-3a1]TFI05806.1 lactonase family protein [Herbaspirillum sp. 3R11]TFI13675.1 lactonase family protein [Herbaspirillum sp. 3R-11]TFI23280.1 lactonase family protein [Herbaspirillum sp. 3C11]
MAGAAVLGCAAGIGANAATMVYVSNADSKDISVLQLNKDGSLKLVEQVPTGGTVMPLAFSPDHHRLYASLRSQPYSVTTFAVDQQSGKLKALATVPLVDNMANLATDKTGRFLFAASYTGHKISVNPISATGLVQEPATVINTGKNAHAVGSDPKNNFVFASNLGSDVILQFKFDAATGKLTPNTPPSVATKAGAGPRHFVFHPNLRYVFSTNELDGTVNTYAYDAAQGTLTLKGTVSAVPAGFKGDAPAAADIHLTPDGRFLYASERTSSTLTAYRVNAKTGELTIIGNFATETQPRGFNIDRQGKYLLAVGQKSNGLTSYAINRKTGALKPLQHYELGKNPNWVEIVAFP